MIKDNFTRKLIQVTKFNFKLEIKILKNLYYKKSLIKMQFFKIKVQNTFHQKKIIMNKTKKTKIF